LTYEPPLIRLRGTTLQNASDEDETQEGALSPIDAADRFLIPFCALLENSTNDDVREEPDKKNNVPRSR
jgi:hypothetical protein